MAGGLKPEEKNRKKNDDGYWLEQEEDGDKGVLRSVFTKKRRRRFSGRKGKNIGSLNRKREKRKTNI